MRSKLEINRVCSVVLNYFINPQIKSLNYLFLNVNSSQAEAVSLAKSSSREPELVPRTQNRQLTHTCM